MISEATELVVLLKEGFRVVESQMLEGLRAAGFPDLRGSHLTVLRELRAEGMRTTDLARQAGITRQAVAQLVAELVEFGYVEQAPDPTDGRAKLVRFTPVGLQGAQLAIGIFTGQEAEHRKRLGDHRMHELKAGLVAIINASTAERGIDLR